jgi:hypothetical protein
LLPPAFPYLIRVRRLIPSVSKREKAGAIESSVPKKIRHFRGHCFSELMKSGGLRSCRLVMTGI